MAEVPTEERRAPMDKTAVTHIAAAEPVALVGRQLLIHRAARLASLGGNVLLFGAAGSGRSAVLHAVARELRGRDYEVHFVDAAGIEDAVELLGLVRRACGLKPGQGANAPSMLVDLSPDAAVRQRVIAIDDLEIPACQELFGRWHRHLWRLSARWVATAEGCDPTPYLDGGADRWWEDGVLPVPALEARQALELCRRALLDAGIADEVPDDLLAGAGGNPRELSRRIRAFLVDHDGVPHEDAGDVGRRPWSTAEASAVEELSADEARLLSSIAPGSSFSLSAPGFLEGLGWSYAKVHRLAKELVRRGVLARSQVPGEVGRPRVVYSAVAVDVVGRSDPRPGRARPAEESPAE
jgi:hypothetical protein